MPHSLPTPIQYEQLRKRLNRVVAVIILLVISVVCWQVATAYSGAKKSAQAQVTTFVRAIDAHIAHSIELVDLSLIGFAQSIARLPASKRNSSDDIQELLMAQGAGVSANFWILYIDASGHGMAATKNLAVEGIDYSDRDYFQAHTLMDQGRHIGAPIVGKASGSRLFTVSRRVEDKSGQFLGVIVALLDARAFADVFENARFNEDVLVTLFHRSGRVIARSPGFAETFGADVRQSLLFQHLRDAESGVYEGQSILDQQNRIYSYQAIAHMPLVASVAISSRVWTASMARTLGWGLAGLLLIIGLLLAGTRLALRSYQQLGHSEDNYRLLYTEIQEAEQRLASSEHRLRTITDNVPALITYIDNLHILRFCNGTFQEWTGLAPRDLMGRPMEEVMGAEQYAQHRTWINRALAGERVTVESQASLRGSPQCLQTIYVPDRLEDGTVVGIYTLSTDVTALKEKEQQLQQLARYDTLTGLPNRRELNERLHDAIQRNRRSGQPLSVMFLDIDYFKSINDQHGHAAGDAVLQEFSHRLQRCLRNTDIVARLAGDEFVVVLDQAHTARDAATVASKIVAAMQAPVPTAKGDLQISTSIGVCHVRTVEHTAEELLSLADEALYQAKANGRNKYALKEC